MNKIQYQAIFGGSADPAVSSVSEIRREVELSGQGPQAVVVLDENGTVLRGHAWPVPADWE